jgi:hypothetical protein
VERLNKHAA